MDAGCGDGRNLAPLIHAGLQVSGVDFSNAALDYCKKNYPDCSNLELIHSSLEKMQLPSGSMDALICDHVLVHARDVNTALDQFYRLLKPDGFALLEFTSHKDSTFGQGEKISEKEFLQEGVYLRYDEPEDIYIMLKKFDILCFTSEYSTDPPHGLGYIRKTRHKHHSYFVLARKP